MTQTVFVVGMELIEFNRLVENYHIILTAFEGSCTLHEIVPPRKLNEFTCKAHNINESTTECMSILSLATTS